MHIRRRAIRCKTYPRFFTVNFLFLILNLSLCLYYVHYYQPRPERHSRKDRSTCNITNHTVQFLDSWLVSEVAYFTSPIDAMERQLLDRMFRTFIQTIEAANLTYFIIGGTLFGSLRHHGAIPWDDDVDIMVRESDADTLLNVLSKLGPDFKLYAMKPLDRRYWKLFPSQGRKVIDFSYRTPFIDIFLYLENKTHVWTATPEWQIEDIWLRRHIFPLHRRPYGELLVSAPCNGLAIIKTYADITMCHSRTYDHLREEAVQAFVLISCDQLAHIYPFVKRSSATNQSSHLVKETLMIGNITIREVMVDQFC